MVWVYFSFQPLSHEIWPCLGNTAKCFGLISDRINGIPP